jgi:predicted amidophosphoribosyltransferase
VDVQSCKLCGRVFSGAKPGICPKCRDKEQDDLHLATESLRDMPNQTVEELSEATGVEEKTILKFIREHKIASDTIIGEVACGRCGKPAQSLAVRLCEKCSAELQKASMGLSAKPKSEATPSPSTEQQSGGTVTPKASDDDGRRVHEAVKGRRG